MDRARALDINDRLCQAYFAIHGLAEAGGMPDLSDVSLADALEASRMIAADPTIEIKPDGGKVITCHVAEHAVARTLAAALCK